MNGTQREADPTQDTVGRLEAMVHLRQQAVEALAVQKQLQERREAALGLADRLEELAVAALAGGRDQLRPLLDQRVEVLKQAECLADQLRSATERANRLKSGLLN